MLQKIPCYSPFLFSNTYFASSFGSFQPRPVGVGLHTLIEYHSDEHEFSFPFSLSPSPSLQLATTRSISRSSLTTATTTTSTTTNTAATSLAAFTYLVRRSAFDTTTLFSIIFINIIKNVLQPYCILVLLLNNILFNYHDHIQSFTLLSIPKCKF